MSPICHTSYYGIESWNKSYNAITTKERIVKRVVKLLLKLSTNNVEKL